MKTKTRKLIAAITATALLGTALGVGAYAITKSNNDFGFKGTYDLNAFAATATEQTKKVAGVSIDTTDALCLTSDINGDNVVDYTLFVSIVDTADMAELSGIKLGYSIGGKYYNGMTEGLSNVIYSSLTVKTTDGGTATVTAEELATNFSKITSPKLIITEVEGAAEGAAIEITSSTIAVHNFTTNGLTSDFFTITGNLATNKGTATYKGLELTQCLKMESSTSITFTLAEDSTVKLVFATSETSQKVKVGLQTAESLTSYSTDSNGIASIDLSAGDYKIAKDAGINLFYIDVVTQHDVHNWSFNKLTKTPTAETTGTAEFVCSEGGETKSVDLPELLNENYDTINVVSDDGHDKVTSYTCTVEGVEITFELTETTHAYSETPSSVTQWNWSKQEDGTYTCTADVVYDCTVCDATTTKSIDATVTSAEGTNVSGEAGTNYTAKIEGTEFSDTFFVPASGTVDMTCTYTFTNDVGNNGTTVKASGDLPWVLDKDSIFTITAAAKDLLSLNGVGSAGAIYVNAKQAGGYITFTVAKAGTLTITYGGNNSSYSIKAESIKILNGDSTSTTVITPTSNTDATTSTVGTCSLTVTEGQKITIMGTTSNRLCLYGLSLVYQG